MTYFILRGIKLNEMKLDYTTNIIAIMLYFNLLQPLLIKGISYSKFNYINFSIRSQIQTRRENLCISIMVISNVNNLLLLILSLNINCNRTCKIIN